MKWEDEGEPCSPRLAAWLLGWLTVFTLVDAVLVVWLVRR